MEQKKKDNIGIGFIKLPKKPLLGNSDPSTLLLH